ncbi:TadE/TadG family type IV pilus assembly protein [Calderihabitans maritimus]|uniref:TadE-like protein n=1 Tax=Calderihabitans maritimus TaxID=1246530 RepID=A0A1Z5HTG9_9FIRM|nr:TadE/TadG family type IV pilus assembly protein [Calderihabitans maritimus]GAW92836.1 TadE-like protein [Calderihabitans maritimus]
MTALKKLRDGDNGQALVELALVLPVLLMLMGGIIETARLTNAYLAVVHGSREGARLGAVGGTDAEIVMQVKRAASPLEPERISVSIYPAEENRTAGEMIEVSVEYSIPLFTPPLNFILTNPYPVKASTVMRVE